MRIVAPLLLSLCALAGCSKGCARRDHVVRAPGAPATVVEAGTGKRLADLYLWPHGGVVRFADGALELVGDRASIAPAIFCRDGTALLPFATCRKTALVEGRFRFD